MRPVSIWPMEKVHTPKPANLFAILLGPATVGAGDSDRLVRASLIASQLLGFGFVRYVWHIEPIASMGEDEILAAMTPNLQRYIDGRHLPQRPRLQRATRSPRPD